MITFLFLQFEFGKKWIILKTLKVWNSLFCYKEDLLYNILAYIKDTFTLRE